MGRYMRAMVQSELHFWCVMSHGVIAGYAVAYPVNVWMVSRKIKHGLMTERRPGSQFDLRHVHAGHGQQGHQSGASAEHHGAGGATGHGEHGGEHHEMTTDATRPQLAAVTGVTSLMLLAGLIVPGFYVNLSLSAHDVGGSIMPPGMIMDFDTPAAAMRDMSAILPRLVSYRAPADARGDQILEPHLDNDFKVYDLEASVIRWN